MSMRKTRTFLVTIDWKSDDWTADAMNNFIRLSLDNALQDAKVRIEPVSLTVNNKPVHKSESKL